MLKGLEEKDFGGETKGDAIRWLKCVIIFYFTSKIIAWVGKGGADI